MVIRVFLKILKFLYWPQIYLKHFYSQQNWNLIKNYYVSLGVIETFQEYSKINVLYFFSLLPMLYKLFFK